MNKDITIYLKFIEECRRKDYTGMITHKHHIIPITMTEYYEGDNINDSKNILKISCEDHFLAHWILANCFDTGHHYFESNLRACGLLFKWAKNPEKVREAISLSRKGKYFQTQEQRNALSEKMKGNQYALGLTHSFETKELIAHKSRLAFRRRFKLPEGVYFLNDDTPKCYRFCPGCNVKIIYRNSEDAIPGEKNKRKCKSCAVHRGPRTRPNKPRKSVLDTSRIGKYDKSGANNPRAMKLKHIESGLEFDCLKDAINWSGIPYGRLKKLIGVEYLRMDK